MTLTVATLVFLVVNQAQAQETSTIAALGSDFLDSAARIVARIFEALANLVGWILLRVISATIWVAQYNGFVSSPAIANGWIIVRDVANMFVIVILLVIAFGTILGIDAYSYKSKTLSTLIIMAIVINFSRTICGLLIDVSQVIMLTFVNGFAQAAGGNFVEMLKINKAMNANQLNTDLSGTSLLVAMAFAFLQLTIALGVVVILLTTLVARIIYLWLLVILSPVTFLMKAVPFGGAQKYYAEWWSMFTKNLVTGPVLAFFLWLSLFTVQNGRIASPNNGFPSQSVEETVNNAPSGAFDLENIQDFIIGIGLLLGGVMMAQQVGGAGIGAGTKMVGAVRKFAVGQVYKRSGLQNRVEAIKGVMEAKERQRKDKVRELTAKYQGVYGKAGSVVGKALTPRQTYLNWRRGRAGQLKSDATKVRARAKAVREQAKVPEQKAQELRAQAGQATQKAKQLDNETAGLNKRRNEVETALAAKKETLAKRPPGSLYIEKDKEDIQKLEQERDEIDAQRDQKYDEMVKFEAESDTLNGEAARFEAESETLKQEAAEIEANVAQIEAQAVELEGRAQQKETQAQTIESRARAVEVASAPIRELATKPLAEFGKKRAADLEQRAAAAEAAGESDEAESLRTKARSVKQMTALPEFLRKATGVGAALTVGGAAAIPAALGATGKVGDQIQAGAKKDIAAAESFKYGRMMDEKDSLAKGTPKDQLQSEVTSIIEGRKPVERNEQLQAAIILAIEKGFAKKPEEIAGLRTQLASLTEDKKILAYFDNSVAEQEAKAKAAAPSGGGLSPQVESDSLNAAMGAISDAARSAETAARNAAAEHRRTKPGASSDEIQEAASQGATKAIQDSIQGRVFAATRGQAKDVQQLALQQAIQRLRQSIEREARRAVRRAQRPPKPAPTP